MHRKALKLHVIDRGRNSPKCLIEINPQLKHWETGNWKVSTATADSLIGGEIYVHNGQRSPSRIGGKVLSYRSNAEGRKIFQFKANPKLSNVTVDSGWGNEKKIVWAVDTLDLNHILPEDDESAFAEGSEKYQLHRSIERDPKLARKAKLKRLSETGALKCDVCTFDFAEEFGELGAGFIEAHHTTPVSKLAGTRRTKLSELALVCANCHRMIHRSKPLLDILGMRALRSGEI